MSSERMLVLRPSPMKTHLFLYPSGGLPPTLPVEITVSLLPRSPAAAAMAVEGVVRAQDADVLAFWDPTLGEMPLMALDQFRTSLDDVWHPGARATGDDEPDLLRFVQPYWAYRPMPARDVIGAVNWRFDLRAAFLRAATIRQLGELDGRFETLPGMARELGWRLIRRGAVCRQFPALLATPLAPVEPSLADRYRLLRRQTSSKWVAYALARRLVHHPRGVRSELSAWRATSAEAPSHPASVGALHRDLAQTTLPSHPTVSVVLPTYGRYRYVAEVLGDLRAQTIVPTQILIADGNPPGEREPSVYEQFRDLPLEVLWHEEPGICSGRNACLARATGDYVWFVDDDSRFEADNLEAHLRVLTAYGADVSVGPAYMRGRPELSPEQREIACSFMDCGTTLCKRSILTRVGGFDMQFNEYLMGEDNDLGLRFLKAGGLMVNNPMAKRFHYLAPVGGSRRKGSVHVFQRWSLRPRPVQSIYYLGTKHFEPAAIVDAMLQASLNVGWRRRDALPATRAWRVRNLLEEVLAAPLTALRLYRSVRIGRGMAAGGPRVPSLSRPDHAEVVSVEQPQPLQHRSNEP